ncbi:MAG: hypothetical protein O3B41_01765 [Bacteroidetes bacterium]|nr:hypothetical protein [Bacteroidota bacterium]
MIRRLKSIKALISQFNETPFGKRFFTGIRVLLGSLVIFILIKQLSNIGWRSLLTNLPESPWFYITIAVMYVTLPVFETSIYSSFFPVPKLKLFSVFVRKKIMNSDLIGYSGDVFVLYWIKDRLGVPEGKVFRFMVDNGITSSLGAFSATGVLFGILIATDSIRWGDFMGENDPMLFLGAATLIGALSFVAYKFRHTLFSLPGKSVLQIYLAHFLRFMFVFCLQIFQWWVVLPQVSFDVWGTMLAIMTISNRLPFVPAKDLLAVAVMLGVSGVMEDSRAAITAMLLTRIAIDRVLNLGIFIPLSLSDRKIIPQSIPKSTEN